MLSNLHLTTGTKPCETSSQRVSKRRLKQTKPDASIIAASESLTHRLLSALNYSRTALNSPCSSNTRRRKEKGEIELNEMFSLGASYTQRNHVIRSICWIRLYFHKPCGCCLINSRGPAVGAVWGLFCVNEILPGGSDVLFGLPLVTTICLGND